MFFEAVTWNCNKLGTERVCGHQFKGVNLHRLFVREENIVQFSLIAIKVVEDTASRLRVD